MEDGDAEALRRRLYRPGASAADLDAYLSTVTVRPDDDAEPQPAQERGPSLRPFVVGGVGALVAAAFGGVLLIGGRAAPAPPAAPTSAPTAEVATGGPGEDQVWFIASGTRPVLDGGERDRARGVAVAEGPDMVRYTVAPGDAVGAVADRFSLCQGDVLLALPYGAAQASLPAGQTLELGRASTRTPPDC